MLTAFLATAHGQPTLARPAEDYPAQVLMHWFINEQVEEEA